MLRASSVAGHCQTVNPNGNEDGFTNVTNPDGQVTGP